MTLLHETRERLERKLKNLEFEPHLPSETATEPVWVRPGDWNGSTKDLAPNGIIILLESDDEPNSIFRLYLSTPSGWLVYFVFEEYMLPNSSKFSMDVTAFSGGSVFLSSVREANLAIDAVADTSLVPALAGLDWSAKLVEALIK